MKKIVLILIIISYVALDSISQTCVSHTYSQNRSYPDKNPARYKFQRNFIPNPTDCVKTLRINLHVMQYKVGDERNFKNIPAHVTFLQGLINTINLGYSKLKVPSHPQTCVCGTDCYIEDTRIRLELQQIYFHVDSVYYNSTASSTLLTLYPKNNSTEYNYYIVGPDTNIIGGSVNKFPSYTDFSLEQANVGQGYHYEYQRGVDSNNLFYHSTLIVKHMIHEISHAYGLHHLYKGHELTDTSRDDYLKDFYGAGTSSCPFRKPGLFEVCNENPPSDTCVSNWVGGNVTSALYRELTPMQIGRIHRSTMLSNMRKYFKPSANHVADHEVTSNETWDFNIRMYGDIVVDSGATLTIRCKVLMPPEGEIRVNANGKLIVDGGTITSTEDGPNNQWAGIRVEGSNSYSQYETYSFGLAHGTVEIKNGALIENATEAIATTEYPNKKGGSGIIKAYNSTFRNNTYGIRLGIYHDLGVHKNKKNQSEVVGCTFEWDSTFFKATTDIKSGIELIGVNKVKIDSCTFIHLYPPAQSFKPRIGIGILTSDASSFITKCTFENMENGLYVQSLLVARPVLAQYNTFKNNFEGMRIMKSEYATLQQNTFNTKNQIGMVLYETKAFKVSENAFYDGANTAIQNRNLGYHSNEIYNNTFTGQYWGISAIGYSNQSNKGLSFKCNYFASNLIRNKDIYVIAGKVDSVQGDCDPTAIDAASLPAGNEFSHTCATNTFGDFYANNHPSKIDYNHHFQVSTGPYRPSCYSTSKIWLNNCITGYNNTESCPDSSFKQSPSGSQWLTHISGIKDLYWDNKSEMDLADYEVVQLIDGGNTSGALDYIDPANNNSSSDIRAEMLSHGPYLSDEVLQACIDRNPALNDSDLYEILLVNSPLSLSLAEDLPNLTNVLTDEQIDDLELVQGGISKRDSIENDVRWYEQQAELALNELLRLYALDTNANDPLDTMIYYLEDWNTVRSRELLVPLYWQNEEFTLAQDAIDDLAAEAGNEHLEFVLQKVHDVLENEDSLTILLSDTTVLDSIAVDSTRAGQVWAQNLMFRLTGKIYPIHHPDTTVEESIAIEPELPNNLIEVEHKNDEIRIYPNPNTGEFVIELNRKGVRKIRVYSLEGRKVYEREIHKSNSKIQVNLPGTLTGIFQVVLYGNNDSILHSEKIVINE
tara:strand:+ start:3740 stop:7219 length:3480 start_codon:yes stop_codon:yes gene_type:complete